MKISKFSQLFTKLFSVIFFLSLATCHPSPASAAVPKLLTYQGLLKDGSGNFLTGTYAMVFKIYTASSGGTAQWTETQSSVSVSSGKFNVQLGSVTTISLDFNSDYWLGITVGADSEMTPRVRLTSSAYGIRSDYENNGFTQSSHDALSHKNVEGVKDNTVNIGKTNFKLDAYSVAAANSMGDMVIDAFNDASGIHSGSSSGYTWRGASNYDVVVTPPTGGVDSYVGLMLHTNGTNGSTTFTDSSTSTLTVTANGNAQISTSQSKFGGASGSFDGSGDYLSVGSHSNFALGTGDFTVDFQTRFNSVGNAEFFMIGGSSTFYVGYSNSNLYVYFNNSTYTFSWSPSANTWYHVAVVRSGANCYAFINGSQIGSTTNIGSGTSLSQNSVQIGEGGGWGLNGYIDELRVSKGIARWTSNFTPDSSEYAVPTPGTATVISNAYIEPVAPTEAMVIADETLGTGSITYYVSRDNGTTWTQCTKETATSISSQPSGTNLKWKAVITGNAELNAVAVAV